MKTIFEDKSEYGYRIIAESAESAYGIKLTLQAFAPSILVDWWNDQEPEIINRLESRANVFAKSESDIKPALRFMLARIDDDDDRAAVKRAIRSL